jgi:hypothetical protein
MKARDANLGLPSRNGVWNVYRNLQMYRTYVPLAPILKKLLLHIIVLQ